MNTLHWKKKHSDESGMTEQIDGRGFVAYISCPNPSLYDIVNVKAYQLACVIQQKNVRVAKWLERQHVTR